MSNIDDIGVTVRLADTLGMSGTQKTVGAAAAPQASNQRRGGRLYSLSIMTGRLFCLHVI